MQLGECFYYPAVPPVGKRQLTCQRNGFIYFLEVFSKSYFIWWHCTDYRWYIRAELQHCKLHFAVTLHAQRTPKGGTCEHMVIIRVTICCSYGKRQTLPVSVGKFCAPCLHCCWLTRWRNFLTQILSPVSVRATPYQGACSTEPRSVAHY